MKLFKRKQNVQPESKAKVLDKPMLIKGEDIDKKTYDEIVKTTDSMQIIASTFKSADESDAAKIEEASNALLRSYDLAVRKIAATFEEIIQTKKVVSNDFLTVQLIIKDFEKNSNIDQVAKVINIFTEEMEQQIAHGRSVRLEDRLIIEPADYVNKIIPMARFVSKDYVNVNTVTWEEIATALQEGSIISTSDKEIIASLVEAVIANVYNGYYVKLGNLVIAKVRPERDELMVLFSSDTIVKLNNIHSNDRLNRRNKVVNKTNYISSFKESVDQTKAKDAELAKKLISVENEGKVNAKASVEEIKQREQEFAAQVEQAILSREEQANKIQTQDVEEQLDIEDVVIREMTKSKKELKAQKAAEKAAAKAAKMNKPSEADIEVISQETVLETPIKEVTKKVVTQKTVVKTTTTKKPVAKKQATATKAKAKKK